MTQPAPEPPPLDNLEEKIRQLQARVAPDKPELPPQATQTGLELVSGVGVGTFLGYWLDTWLGTLPWCLVAGFFLGAAGGFMAMIRASEAGVTDQRLEDTRKE